MVTRDGLKTSLFMSDFEQIFGSVSLSGICIVLPLSRLYHVIIRFSLKSVLHVVCLLLHTKTTELLKFHFQIAPSSFARYFANICSFGF